MKKNFIMLITQIICLVSICNFSYALIYPRKPVAIPPDMYNMNTPSELEIYLNDPDPRKREAAVKRLGQLRDSNTISVLRKFYDNEEYESFIVKYTVILSLRKIGGDEAKRNIIEILTAALKSGPLGLNHYNHDTYTRQVREVIWHAIRALSDFQSDDVIQALKRISKNQDPPSDGTIAENAKKSLIIIELNKQGFKKPNETVNYLVNMLTGVTYGPTAIIRDGVNLKRTKDGLINKAVSSILEDLGAQILPYLENNLLRITGNSPRAKSIRMVMDKIKVNTENHSNEVLAVHSIKSN